MLTKNTSRFVKALALVMAVLMVMAVCLTGCTDADAQAAAQKAQESADAAKTAADASKKAADEAKAAADSKTTTEAVAAQITAALAGYLKEDAALKKADVEKLVADSIKDYAKKSDIPSLDGYAKAADLTNALKGYTTSDAFNQLKNDLNGSLNNKANKSDIDTAVNKALATYATTSYVDEAIGKAKDGCLTAAEVQGLIDEALKNYYSKDDVNGKIGDLEALVQSYLGTRSPEEVQAAMTWMIEAKEDNDFMSLSMWNKVTDIVIETIGYLDDLYARMDEGGYLEANIGKINAYMADAYDIAENINFFQQATSDDPDAVAEMKKLLEYRILRCATLDEIGELKEAAKNASEVPNFDDEWEALMDDLDDDALYTEKTAIASTDATPISSKISTIYNKAAFHAFNEKVDDLLVKYIEDPADPLADHTDYKKVVYKKVTKQTWDSVEEEWSAPSAPMWLATVPANTETEKYSAVLDKTIAYNGEDLMPDADPEYVVSNLLALGIPGLTTYTTTNATYTKYGTIEVIDDIETYGEKYYIVYKQIQNAQDAIKAADDAFGAFLNDPLGYTSNKTDYADKIANLADGKTVADVVAMLKAYMCDDLYDVADLKNAATLINGDNGDDGETLPAEGTWADYTYFDNYYLYRSLLASAFDKMLDKYLSDALGLLTKIHNDYQSAIMQAVAYGDYTDGDIALPYADYTAISAAIENANCSDETYNLAFYNGGDFTWTYQPTSDITGPAFTFPGIVSMNSVNAINDAIDAIGANSVNMTTEIGAAIVKATNDILNFDRAAAKTSGVTPRDAFKDILQGAVDSLNEVMYRYLIDAMKEAAVDNLFAQVDIMADLYVTSAAGVKILTIKDAIVPAAKGYVDAGDVTEYALLTTYNLSVNEVKARLAQIVAADIIKIDINATGITFEGTEAMEKIDEIYEQAKLIIENFIIRCCLQDYISTAKMDLFYVQQAYAYAVQTDINNSTALTVEINKAYEKSLDKITIMEYQLSKGSFEIEKSKPMYVEILNLITTEDNEAVINYLFATEAQPDALAAMKECVISYNHEAWFKAAAAEGVKPFFYVPVSPIEFSADVVNWTDLDSTCVGTAVIALDKVVNPALY